MPPALFAEELVKPLLALVCGPLAEPLAEPFLTEPAAADTAGLPPFFAVVALEAFYGGFDDYSYIFSAINWLVKTFY